MLKLKKIKRTKRELKYIDIIANCIGLLEGFDCCGEISINNYEMLKHFKLSNYDLKLIKRILTKFEYFTYIPEKYDCFTFK